jgi:hypothetical protein
MWLLLACRSPQTAPPAPSPESEPELYPTDRVLQVELDLDPADWEALRRQERDFVGMFSGDCLAQPFEDPFTEFPATLTVDGTRLEQVNVRKKGMLGSLDLVRPSLKLDLNDEVEGRVLAGQDKLTLNNQVEDPSQIRTCATYDLLRELGLPAPRCALAHLVVNGEDKGLYAHVEDIEDLVLPRHGLDGGDLYEGSLSDFTETYRRTFEPKTDTTDPGLGAILAVQEALELDDAQFVTAIEEVVDVEQFLTHWMGESLVGHWDSYSATRNNYFVARSPGGKLMFLPWGVDSALGLDPAWQQDPDSTPVAMHAALPWRLHAVPETRAQMFEVLDRLLQSWDEDTIVARVEELDALAAPFRTGDLSGEIALITRFVRERRALFEDHRQELDTPREPPVDSWQCIEEVEPLHLEFELLFGEAQPGELLVNSTPGAATCGWSPYDGSFELLFQGETLGGALSVHPELLHDPVIPVTGISAYGYASGPGLSGLGLLGGEIVFEVLGTEPGSPVSGHFEGSLYEMPYQGTGGSP